MEYWLWLSSCAVSPRAKAALLDRFGDAEGAFLAPAGAFSRLEGVSGQEAETLDSFSLHAAVKTILRGEDVNAAKPDTVQWRQSGVTFASITSRRVDAKSPFWGPPGQMASRRLDAI